MNHLKYPCFVKTKADDSTQIYLMNSEQELLDFSVQLLRTRCENGMYDNRQYPYKSFEEFVEIKTGMSFRQAVDTYNSITGKPDGTYGFCTFMEDAEQEWQKEQKRVKWLASFGETLNEIDEGKKPARAAYTLFVQNSSEYGHSDLYFRVDNFNIKEHAR